MPAPVTFFLFGLGLAWFTGTGKLLALINALKIAPTSSGASPPIEVIPTEPIPHGPGDNPEGGGAGQPRGSPTNPTGPVVPGPLMPHG